VKNVIPPCNSTSSLNAKSDESANAEVCVLLPEKRTCSTGQEKSKALSGSGIATKPEKHIDKCAKEKVKVSHDKTLEDSVPDASNEATFETVRKPRKKDRKKVINTFTLPEGVEVICDHYEKETLIHWSLGSGIPKVCQGCESRSHYAYWSELLKKWIRVRKVPSHIPKSNPIESCYNYQIGKKCKKCTYAHGPELQMWDLQRRGGNI
jgi:hypothetical protein